MADYAVMPKADYLDACNAIREKTSSTDVIKSGEMGAKIRAISGSDEKEVVQVVVKGADPNACRVWDVKQNAWVDYTTSGVTVNVIDYLAIYPNGQVMQGLGSYIQLKDGTKYKYTGEVGGMWLVGNMESFSIMNFAYTSYDSFLHVHYNTIKAEDIDHIYITTLED